MAAQEYYYGTGLLPVDDHQPNPYPPHQKQYHYQQTPTQSPNEPPPYSAYPPQHHQQQTQGYAIQPYLQATARPPPTSAPYPTSPITTPQTYAPQPPQNNNYLGPPARPTRSHSQPPRVRFADDIDSDESTERSYPSDSDESRRRHHHRRRKHRHSHSHSHSQSDSDPETHRGHHSGKHEKKHRNRDTFLGAGAGGLVGDLIFPGLGTAAGLLLGGYGGRKHAQKRRSRSESAGEYRHGSDGEYKGRRKGGGGWDGDTATYKKGNAVR